MTKQTDRSKAFRTLFIGLGGTGNEIVRRVKQEMLRHNYDLPIFQYLVLDTVPFHEDADMPSQRRLHNGEEYLYIGGYNPNEILKQIDGWPVIAQWWGTRDQTNLVTVDEGAGQMRSVGRMGFFRHFTSIQARLERMVKEVMSNSNREQAMRQHYEVPSSKPPIVYIVFSLCGGTGSSLFFDMAYVLRKMFDVKPTIVGIAMMPNPYIQEISSTPQRERIQANTYAALQELERLHSIALGQEPRPNGKDIWDVQYATNFRVSSPDLPFDYIYLIDDTTTNGEHFKREQIYGQVSQAIFWLSGPSTAIHFWERAKNLISNTLAGGGLPDSYGRLRLPKYSSLGISVAALDWDTKRIHQELEGLILDNIMARTTTKSLPPSWLTSADMLLNTINGEPDVNPILPGNAFKPCGPFRDRAAVDDLMENYTRKYSAALESLPRSLKWMRCRDKYRQNAQTELNNLFRKSLVERGPIAARQEIELMKNTLQTVRDELATLDTTATREQADLQNDYERQLRAPTPDSRVALMMQALGNGIKKIYGMNNKSASRDLLVSAKGIAHQRYLWYAAGMRVYFARDTVRNIIEPAITHADKLLTSLDDIDNELHTWRYRISQSTSAAAASSSPTTYEDVIPIKPRTAERNIVEDAIKKGTLRFEPTVNKILQQAFTTWPHQGGNARADLQKAMDEAIVDIIQFLGEREHILERLQSPEMWMEREMFLQRSECLWSFGKDATQEVLAHLEPINMLGYGVEHTPNGEPTTQRNLTPYIDDLLKQQSTRTERVSTNASGELMYLKTSHGLMVSLITSMPELHHAYQVLNVVRAAPYLHLDYRDQVQAGYGPLTGVEMGVQQIINTWQQAATTIEGSMSDTAKSIRLAIDAYKKDMQSRLKENVQIKDEKDPFFDLVTALEKAIKTQNRTPAISELLTNLSDLIGLLHAQGWAPLDPPPGTPLDPSLHEVDDVELASGLPRGRIIEVRMRGYIRSRQNATDQVYKARVLVSAGPNPNGGDNSSV